LDQVIDPDNEVRIIDMLPNTTHNVSKTTLEYTI